MSLKIEDKVYFGKAKPSSGGGSTPVIDELNVTPSTSAQLITAPQGTDGYNPVKVAAVTSSIDANITAGNIKKDVSILGVTGSYEGVAPSGTKPITTNGIHDVAGYASADVQVPTTAPASYRVFQKNASGKLVNSTSTPWIPLPAGTTDINGYLLYQAYQNTPSSVLSGAIDLSSLTTISGDNAIGYCFFECSGITSFDLSSLTTVSGSNAMSSCFYGCTGITSVNLSSLTTVSGTSAMGSCFKSCLNITSVNLSSLTTISGYGAMGNCFQATNITSVDLSSVITLNGGNAMNSCFQNCLSLTTLSFGGLKSTSFGSNTNQFNNMLRGVTGCTVHFPSNLQSVIGSWSDVTNGFGGTNTTVLFDLPATE